MSLELVAPGIVVVVLAVGLGVVRTPLPPRTALRLLTLASVSAAAITFIIVSATAAGFLLGPSRSSAVLHWCRVLPLHHRVGTAVGLGATLSLVVIALRMLGVLKRHTAALGLGSGRRIDIVDTPEPLAFAVPRGAGCIVVSTGLLRALDPRERQVVFAHERAHLRQGHHRFLLAGALAQAVFPPLKPLLAQLRHATERCADEEAVAAMYGDRTVVATAIARAALQMTSFGSPLPSFGGGTVPARVEALVGRRPDVILVGMAVVVAVIAAITIAGGASMQLHHLYTFYDHVCHG